nr:DUF3089 domain-containing protein [uncultured Sphingomonas sp.]
MCARRFLGCIFIFVLLAVAAAFLMFQFGDRVLTSMATPKGHYQTPAENGPDYARADSWLAKPGDERNLADWLPVSATGQSPTLPAVDRREAATFYIHPTTYLLNDRWNAPLDLPSDIERRTDIFVQSQASAFNGVSMIWAPRYRQAAFGAFLLQNDDATKALNLAYGDVLKAFDHFMAANPGKPIILAGHSQGSLHLLRLLTDRKDALTGRLVAAYVVGWPVSSVADLAPTGLPACTDAAQSGCVASWESFRDPANPELVLKSWQQGKGPNGVQRRRADIICTNPLNGGAASDAAPGANLGTLVPDGDLGNASLQPGRVGATCHDGLLLIDGAVPDFGPYVLPGNNYHVYDYALYWGSIRADAANRLAAWKSSQ